MKYLSIKSTTVIVRAALWCLVSGGAVAGPPQAPVPAALDAVNVRWDSPSENSAGSMPLGNGEVVVNAWVEKATGDLLLLLARTDALSETGRFCKLGRLRLHLEGGPLLRGGDFRQELCLREGMLAVTGGGVSLRVFVDSGAHVLHVTGESNVPVIATATVETWRDSPRDIGNDHSCYSLLEAPFRREESADVFLPAEDNSVTWYHRNEVSYVPKLLENQSLTGAQGATDPLLHRTFGGLLTGPGFIAAGPRTLKTAAPQSRLDLRLATHSAQTATLAGWRTGLQQQADQSLDAAAALARTRAWWAQFWGRSHVFVINSAVDRGGKPVAAAVAKAGGDSITRGYILQRYAQGFQGRGAYPIKFNGGFFNVEPHINQARVAPGRVDADWRAWGDCYWWQNTRHMYHPMLACGDFDLMEPLFRMYENVRVLAEARTARYHGAQGAYFPETMTAFGTYGGANYGWDRTGREPKDIKNQFIGKMWNPGTELVALMLDRWDYTQDEEFLKRRLLPMAVSVLRHFDTRFKKDSQGKLVIDPTQAAETYWNGVVNDTPTVAGIANITRRLCALPPGMVDPGDQVFLTKIRAACPAIPMEPAGDVRKFAPAEKYEPKRANCENPETYPIWPYREASLSRPEWLAEGKATYARRGNRLPNGWGYDGNCAALLGLTDEAAGILIGKCANSNGAYRWPATWGPNYDWLPDQNHGGNLMETTNLMLLQGEAGGKILLLPAWPQLWDVEFKLHTTHNTTVECQLKDGRIIGLNVVPASRRGDLVLPEWAKPQPGAAASPPKS
jgi:hypothetical protein